MEVFHLAAIAIILALTFVAFAREWFPPDLVAMGAFALCIILGMLKKNEVAAVFQNSAPLTIGAMFVLSAALVRTGVIDSLAHYFQRAAQNSERRALAMLALIVLPLSAMVNNTPVVVVFLPVVIAFARSSNLSASRLLMPLSILAILGGTMTLVGTSTNILVAGVAQKQGLEPFGIFEITPLGLIYASAGTVYLMMASRWLPHRSTVSSLFASADTRDFLSTATVPASSPLAGKAVKDGVLGTDRTIRIFDVIRGGQRVIAPLDQMVLQPGDQIVLKASPRGIATLSQSGDLIFGAAPEGTEASKVKLVEVMIGPLCSFDGKTLSELRLRQQHGIVVAALHRAGANLMDRLNTLVLHAGDTLLIEAPEENLKRFEAGTEGLIFLNDRVEQPFRRRRAPLAIAAILGVIIVSALGILPILEASLIGAVAVMGLGCVDPREAYASIEWPILFIIFGMLGVGQAMENTGAVKIVAEAAANAFAPWGPVAVLAALYLLASVLTELITNNAVAILLTPIAISIGHDLGVDPRGFVVAIMFGASASFCTPIGYQTNTYVFGAGGYRFSDFPKFGIPLNLFLWIVAILVIPVFWKF